MSFRPAQVVNCKKASIRRTPWIPLHDEEISGYMDGSSDDSKTVSSGKTIDIDTEEVVYDWTGRKFFKVKRPKGWIYEGCVKIGGDNNEQSDDNT